MISSEYFFSGIDLRGTTEHFNIYNSKGKIEGFRIIKRRARFRFEREIV